MRAQVLRILVFLANKIITKNFIQVNHLLEILKINIINNNKLISMIIIFTKIDKI